MDIQIKNNLKSKYYDMFDGKIDKEIIDVVLQTCYYQDDQVYQRLIEMAGDALDTHPSSPGSSISQSELQVRASFLESFNRNDNFRELVETDSPRAPATGSPKTVNRTDYRDYKPYEREVSKKEPVQSGLLNQKQQFIGNTDMDFNIQPSTIVPRSSKLVVEPGLDVSTLTPLPKPKDYLAARSPLHQQRQTLPSSFGTSEPSVFQQLDVYGNDYTSIALSERGQYESSLLTPVSSFSGRGVQHNDLYRYPNKTNYVRPKIATPLLPTPSQVEKSVSYQDENSHWLVLMRGLPGSGKSTKAKKLSGGKGFILSTDDYFIDYHGRYNFDPSKLPEAHDWNQLRARNAMSAKISPIIIDNTNVEAWNMKHYVATALRFEYMIDIVEPDAEWAWDPYILAKRNQHGVRSDAIQRMKDKYQRNVTVDFLTKMVSGRRSSNGSSTSSNTALLSQSSVLPVHDVRRDKQHPLSRSSLLETVKQPLLPIPIATPNVANSNNINSGDGYATLDQIRTQPIQSGQQNQGDLYFHGRPYGTLPTERRSVNLPIDNTSSSSYNNTSHFEEFQKKQSHLRESPYVLEQTNVTEPLLRHNAYESHPGITSRGETTAALSSPSSVNPRDYHQLNEKLKDYKFDSNPASPQTQHTGHQPQAASSRDVYNVESEEELSSGLVKNSSGTTLTAKQLKIRENLHKDFSHVDKEALDQLLESCSYNYEAASNFVRYSVPAPASKKGKKGKEPSSTPSNIPKKSASEPNTKSSAKLNVNSVAKRNNGELLVSHGSLTDLDYVYVPDEQSIAGEASSLVTISDDMFPDPPKVSRTVDNESSADLHSHISRRVSGKIDNIVESYKNVQSKLDVIDSSGNNSTPCCSSYTEEFNAFMNYNLQFLYECFPNYSKKYCQKWLNLYNGDLVKTCDYLSRRSQTDELPVDVINVDSDDDFEMLEISSDEEEENSIAQTSPVAKLDVESGESKVQKGVTAAGTFSSGGLFLCDENRSSEMITMAIDKSLGIELKKRFGRTNDFSEDELDTEDLVFTLNKDVAKLLYTAWNSSVKERKRKYDYLDEDERLARELQDEVDKELKESQDKTDGRSKKKKTKGTKLDISITKDELIHLQAENKSPWKRNSNVNQAICIEDCSGKKLTKKQSEARKRLYGMFPGLQEDALDQILESTSYNVDDASNFVTQSTGTEKNTDTCDENSGWKTVISPPRKKHNDSNTPVATSLCSTGQPLNIDGFQAMSENSQSYEDLRAEAQIHANLRTQYFRKAAQAFQSKNGQLAQVYADTARDHTRQMENAHFRAAEMTLIRRNKPYLKEQKVIDLHGLHAEEAKRALKNFLDNAVNIGHREVQIITGRGNHSKNGISTVRNSILSYLNQKHYKYQLQNNGGSVKIRL